MKRTKRNLEVFNLSFLDIISCGFAAVIILVLISGRSEYRASDAVANENGVTVSLLKSIFSTETRIAGLSERLAELKKQLAVAQNKAATLEDSKEDLQARVGAAREKMQQLQSDAKGLELVQASLKRTSISRDTASKRDDMVGGIPVDSDYVIFIVDTSGSMKQIWSRVIAELENVLDIHPKVKGFQVLSDNGAYLLSGYAKKWIPDTPGVRKSVLKLLSGWHTSSNSSPVEGLQAALRTYARSGKNISIYIFGDDYTGSSYGPVLNTLDSLNRSRSTGKPLIKVHGIGFISRYSTNRFGILMREVARRNRGTFLALP